MMAFAFVVSAVLGPLLVYIFVDVCQSVNRLNGLPKESPFGFALIAFGLVSGLLGALAWTSMGLPQ